MPGYVDQCCVGGVEGLLGFAMSLGRVRAASWFDLLACGSDGLSISWGFIVFWSRVGCWIGSALKKNEQEDKNRRYGCHCEMVHVGRWGMFRVVELSFCKW